MGRAGVSAERLGQALGGLPLLRVEVGGNDQLEDDVLVAAASAVQRRQAAPAEQPDVAVLGARRDLERDLALERRRRIPRRR